MNIQDRAGTGLCGLRFESWIQLLVAVLISFTKPCTQIAEGSPILAMQPVLPECDSESELGIYAASPSVAKRRSMGSPPLAGHTTHSRIRPVLDFASRACVCSNRFQTASAYAQ